MDQTEQKIKDCNKNMLRSQKLLFLFQDESQQNEEVEHLQPAEVQASGSADVPDDGHPPSHRQRQRGGKVHDHNGGGVTLSM